MSIFKKKYFFNAYEIEKNKKQPISLFLYLSVNSIEKVETFTSNDQRSPKNVFTKRYRKKVLKGQALSISKKLLL